MLPIIALLFLLCPATSLLFLKSKIFGIFWADMPIKLLSPIIVVASAYSFPLTPSLLYKYQFPIQEDISAITTAICHIVPYKLSL